MTVLVLRYGVSHKYRRVSIRLIDGIVVEFNDGILEYTGIDETIKWKPDGKDELHEFPMYNISCIVKMGEVEE